MEAPISLWYTLMPKRAYHAAWGAGGGAPEKCGEQRPKSSPSQEYTVCAAMFGIDIAVSKLCRTPPTILATSLSQTFLTADASATESG